MTNTLYEVLGLSSDATPEEIKTAFKRLAKIYHPDVALMDKEVAGEVFKDIVKAYTILSDKYERQTYDHSLRNGAFKIPSGPKYEWTYLPYLDRYEWVLKSKNIWNDHHKVIYG